METSNAQLCITATPNKMRFLNLFKSTEDPDFDAEGREVMAHNAFNDLDEVWRHSLGGGRVYIGNIDAAHKSSCLLRLNITHIVNCQDEQSQNFHESNPRFTYFRFHVARWPDVVLKEGWKDIHNNPTNPNDNNNNNANIPAVLQFFSPLFEFVDNATSRGENVLIHCLAGAHRAGTTGVAYVMHASATVASVDGKANGKHMSLADALKYVQRRRPIVSPFGHLMVLLRMLERAQHATNDDGVDHA
jgi:predicted protein tyrosine phosphatase